MTLIKIPRRSPPNSGVVPRSRGRVLYVEDNDENWEITEMALADSYSLQRARTSREAFHYLQRGTFDLVLLDIELQGSELNGIAICEILKGRATGTRPLYAAVHQDFDAPVVFVTAYEARHSRMELIALGADDVMYKPVDFVRMTGVMTRLTARRAAVIASRVHSHG